MEKEIEEIVTAEDDMDENNNENRKYVESRVYYVYKHVRLDNNTCFYIGKGKNGRKDDPNRNPTHDSICKEHGYKVVIFKDKLNEAEAFKLEEDLIRCYVLNMGYGICIKGYMNNNNKFLTNRTWGGEGPSGYKHSEESKQKMSKSHKGIKQSEESKRKISEKMTGENHPFYGKHHTEETKENISEKLKGKMTGENHPFYGKHHTEETKENISEKLKGENNPFYGKHRSEETKIKMSEAKKGENNPFYGKHHTEEYKKNMSEKMKGENHPFYGKHHSKETIEKLSKKVICINTGKKFDSLKDASNWYNVAKSSICDCCKGKRKSAGKLNGVRLQWKYLEEDDYNESKAV